MEEQSSDAHQHGDSAAEGADNVFDEVSDLNDRLDDQ